MSNCERVRNVMSSTIAKLGALALLLSATALAHETSPAALAAPSASPAPAASAKSTASSPAALAAPSTAPAPAAKSTAATTNPVAGAQAAVNQSEECRKFVQTFYDWYAPIADKESGGAMSDIMKKKGNLFSSDLRTKLLEDAAAQAKVKGEIVGLDFDPFLNTNSDVAKKYVATKVVQKGNSYLVDVHAVTSGKKSATPTVTPAVGFVNGKCVFINFHYGKDAIPENENLISVLKSLANDRKSYAKEAAH